MNGESTLDTDDSDFVEVDPSGRYGRYNEILGKGSSKIVFRGFDEYEGIEVAWNQVKLYDFLRRPEDLERLYCEIHLLKTLQHKSIIKFYGSWIDSTNRNLNFVTEMFTSGTLREYRMKHKRVNIKAIKDWCRQILEGLHYLHSLDPPVIHRDLKCDNIFINGHQGQVKIGDLGLAAILRKSHAARCVGTPEFMAPEVYAEEYNELVDIYAFGMCILEMVTFEYPYSECTHPAQIYKKVVSGKKPDALYKVKDPEVRRFVEKCLATVSCRLTAEELLKDPFLQSSNSQSHHPYGLVLKRNLFGNPKSDPQNCLGDYEFEKNEIDVDVFTSEDDEDGFAADAEIAINGRRSEDDDIFLRLRIVDKEGHVRNIYFSFDTETDTAMSVATEMVAELDMPDQDVTKIANMIDGQISSLVPEWMSQILVEENSTRSSNDDPNTSHDCTSGDSYMCTICTESTNLQVLHCSHQGFAGIHGRFEEITYKFEEGQASEEETEKDDDGKKKKVDVDMEKEKSKSPARNRLSLNQSSSRVITGYGNEVMGELRWLKAKYQMQQLRRGVRDEQNLHPSSSSPDLNKAHHLLKGKHFRSYTDVDSMERFINQASGVCDGAYEGCFYKDDSIHRAISLPVDAVDF